MNKPHHNTGRRNAAKDESERASSHIQIRCKSRDKSLIVRNLAHGESIASFMLGLALKEAQIREDKQ